MVSFADQRIVKGAPATISWQGVDQDGESADPGTVTVGITRADGTVLVAAGTATTGAGANPRTVALTAAQTKNLDVLTATWSVGADVLATTTVQVVGGVYVSVDAIRTADALVLGDAYTDATERIRDGRVAFEQIAENETGVAWVPRFDVERLDGSGMASIRLGWPELRRVRWCRIWTSDTAYDELTTAELAAIPANAAGVAVRADGEWWPVGRSNIEIAYEHGVDTPPRPLVDACVTYVRAHVRSHNSAIPGGAQTVSIADGSTYAILPAATSVTGIDSVDRVLRSMSRKTPGIA
jgi:hypothetical protein